MKKFFATLWNAFMALVKNLWFWLLCGLIALGSATPERKIISIVILTIVFPLIAAIITLWFNRIHRKRKPPKSPK